jgi:DNA-binding CsgD family transcriptional regulator
MDSERRVAELVAEGSTNREAAAALVISMHTVDSHLRHVFGKLGISSRVQLAAVVTRQQG